MAALCYTDNATYRGFNLAYYQVSGNTVGSGNVPTTYADLHVNNLTVDGTTNLDKGGIALYTVIMPATSSAYQNLTLLATTGSYLIIVSGSNAGDASATFAISKTNASGQSSTWASILRLTSCVGNNAGNACILNMFWDVNSTPSIYHATVSTNTVNIVYKVRVVMI